MCTFVMRRRLARPLQPLPLAPQIRQVDAMGWYPTADYPRYLSCSKKLKTTEVQVNQNGDIYYLLKP